MSKAGTISAQAYVDIQNLYASYNICSDAGDAEGFAGCFTEDGVLRVDAADLTVQGRDNFREFKRKEASGRTDKYRRHWNGSIHLEKIDDDTVRGRCYLVAYQGVPRSMPQITDCAVYEDTIVRVDDEWRFAERKLMVDGSNWLSEMPR